MLCESAIECRTKVTKQYIVCHYFVNNALYVKQLVGTHIRNLGNRHNDFQNINVIYFAIVSWANLEACLRYPLDWVMMLSARCSLIRINCRQGFAPCNNFWVSLNLYRTTLGSRFPRQLRKRTLVASKFKTWRPSSVVARERATYACPKRITTTIIQKSRHQG
jgi:hypothetical protein